MFTTKSVITFVARFVGPCLNSVTMLKVIFPHSLVLGTVYMLVYTTSVCFIVSPIAIIDVSVYMDEATLAVSPVFPPFARVFCSVTPSLLTEAISESSLPLTCVNGASLESVSRSLFTRLILIVNALCHCFSRFFLSKVFATS